MGCVSCCLKFDKNKHINSNQAIKLDHPETSAQLMRYQELDNQQNYVLKTSQSDFSFTYIEGQPDSLIVTKSVQRIYKLLRELPVYVWVGSNKQVIWESKFISQIKEPLIKTASVIEAKDIIKKNYSIILICSISLTSQIQFAFSKQSRVKKIFYLFDPLDALLGKEEKIYLRDTSVQRNIFDNTDELIRTLKIYSEYFSQEKPKQNFIFFQNNISTSRVLFTSLQRMISTKSNRKELMREMQKLSKLLWVDSSQRMKIQKFVQIAEIRPLTIKEAIEWYTKESFLSKLINNLLRVSRSPTQIFILQPFFHDLFNAIKKLYEKSKNNYQSFCCYRGGWISQAQITQFRKKVGKTVQNLYFMSTSQKFEVAKNNIQNLLIIIHVTKHNFYHDFDYGFAFLKQYTAFPEEQQVLFNPFNTFRILKVEKSKLQYDYYVITLEYGILPKIMIKSPKKISHEEQILKKIGFFHLTYLKQNKMGNILQKKNFESEGVLQYWKKYTQISKNCGKMHNYQIGLNQIAQKQAFHSNLSNSIDILLKYLLKDDKNANLSWIYLQNIFECLQKQIPYPESKFYLQKIIQFFQKNYSKGQLQRQLKYGAVLVFIWKICIKHQEYEKGLFYLKKSLGIKLPQYQLLLIQGYIGVSYKKLNQPIIAKPFLQKCIKSMITQIFAQQLIFQTITIAISLVSIYIVEGNYLKAIKLLQYLLPYTLSSGRYNHEILYNLGFGYMKIGKSKQAFQYLYQAFQIIDRDGWNRNYLTWILYLHDIIQVMKYVKEQIDLDVIFSKFQRFSYHYFNKLKEKQQDANIVGMIGQCYYKFGVYDRAVDTFETYFKICKFVNFYVLQTYLENINYLTECYIAQRKPQQFIQKLQKFVYFKKVKFQNRQDCAKIKAWRLHKKLRMYQKGRQAYLRSIRILEQNENEQSQFYINILLKMIKLSISSGRLMDTIFYLCKVKICQRAKIMDNKKIINQSEERAYRKFGSKINFHHHHVLTRLFQRIEKQVHKAKFKQKFYQFVINAAFQYPLTI